MPKNSPDLGPLEMTPEITVRICSDMPVGMAAVSSEGKFLWVNNFFCRMLDRSEGEMLNMRFQDIAHEEYFELHNREIERVKSGEITSYSMTEAFKRNGDTVQRRRLIYGSSTVWRVPLQGDFEFFITFFVPYDSIREPSWNLVKKLEYVKSNWRWWIALISAIIGLLTGASQLTFDTLRLEKDPKQGQEIQSAPPSGGSSLQP